MCLKVLRVIGVKLSPTISLPNEFDLRCLGWRGNGLGLAILIKSSLADDGSDRASRCNGVTGCYC